MTLHTFQEFTDRRETIRAELRSRGLDMLIVPRFDPHMAEYAAPHDDRLAWATGFTGSAGVCVITMDSTVIFIDGRYAVQVRQQCPAQLFTYRHLHDEPLADWIASETKRGQTIGYDPMLMPPSWHQRLLDACDKAGSQLVATEENIIDQLWLDQPPAPTGRVIPFGPEKSGRTLADKRDQIVAKIAEAEADFLVEAQPDNIAWLLNIRGADIPFNPFANSFMLLDRDGAITWFVDQQKLPQNLDDFELSSVDVRAPETMLSTLKGLASQGKTALIDPDFAPVATKLASEGEGGKVVLALSPITLTKAIKNEVELQGFRDCHIYDSAAWLKFDQWLQAEVPARAAAGNPVRELEAEGKILQIRQENPGFVYESFNSISAAAGNAAMCHYKSKPESNAPILPTAGYLLDSGGQYEGGTTDSTRTYVFGEMPMAFREAYTAVLQGFIALSELKFPKGTQGHHIDAFARAPLWAMGLDYDHGTGHGIGHFLSVHEQPQRIGKQVNKVDLRPGMVISIEPGFYEADHYGIRIENLFEIVEVAPGFMGFATLGFMPIGTAPLLLDRLSVREKAWLNTYHAQCAEKLASVLDANAQAYLKETTQPI